MAVEIRNNTNEQYHAVSNSMLSVFLGDRFEDGIYDEDEYFARFVARTKPSWRKQRYLDIGTAAHTAALEPEKFAAEVATMPPYVKRRSGKMWQAFEAEHRGKVILQRSELQAVMAMVSSLRAAAGTWLDADGFVEKSLYWKDPVTGLNLRARPDKVICLGDMVLIVDLKTTHINTAREFSFSYRKYNYGIQDIHYREAVKDWFGRDPLFRFLVVQSGGDYCARKFQSTEKQLQLSRDIRRRALDRLADLYETKWRVAA